MALITPAVTLGSVLPSTNPYGLPIAIAHSPMSNPFDVPSVATGSFFASILRTARSFASSIPMSLAGYVAPSRSAMLIFWAPVTTCAFVTMTPSS